MNRKKILVLPGDGIGREVCDATLPVFEVLDLPIKLTFGDIGWSCWEQEGNTIPDETWKLIKQSDAVLLGAITSKGKDEAENALPNFLRGKNHQYVSPVIQLRQKLGLFANIRPAKYITGAQKPFNLCVIRENTEGLYSGFDYRGIPDFAKEWLQHPNINHYGPEESAWTVRLQTRYGLERLFRKAFDYATEHKMNRVTFADKPNVMRESGQFAKEIFFSIANQYPNINADIHNVDAIALWLVKKPQDFGVIVAENMFGDILSDLAAGVMGGLGLAPSANIGSEVAYFEPVHGSAPKLAGQNKANPCAMFLTIALMLDHLGYKEQAEKLENAVTHVMRIKETVSYDLGGSSSTTEVAAAVIKALVQQSSAKNTAIVTIGDELLSGKCANTNLTELSVIAESKGYKVTAHMVCPDSQRNIEESLIRLAGDTDLIIVCGGLGPTSDDRTRYAIAKAAGQSLIHNDDCWEAIRQRLTNFGVTIDDSNRIQAMFPEEALVLENRGGTAPGFSLHIGQTQIIALPGPPAEAKAILEASLPELHCGQPETERYQWALLGISESEIGSLFSNELRDTNAEIHYLWQYPYVHVEVLTTPDNTIQDQTLQSIHSILKPYLVSQNGKKASELLAEELASISWTGDDEALNELCDSWNGCHSGSDQTVIRLTLAPSLKEIKETGHYQGIATLLCVTEDEQHSNLIQFPCRGPEIDLFIQEYSAWFGLKLLQNGAAETTC